LEYSVRSKSIIDSYPVDNFLPDIGIDKVREELTDGLTSSPKFIPSKYFYDKKGSLLFEEITELDEYYPTRTEKSILADFLPLLNLNFTDLSIIELGSGDPSKISLLFEQISPSKLNQIVYYPVDISQSAIESSISLLTQKYDGRNINGIIADFIHQVELLPKVNNKLICFFGSTIGNLKRNEIQIFMKKLGAVMQKGDNLLLGIDMIKDVKILENAYNDSQGVTASFNKNILNVVNKLLGTNFNPSKFEHLAFYNNQEQRIEMHLKAKENLQIEVSSSNVELQIKQGEMIHTENSHKFNSKDIQQFAYWGGLNMENVFNDENNWFSLVHYRK